MTSFMRKRLHLFHEKKEIILNLSGFNPQPAKACLCLYSVLFKVATRASFYIRCTSLRLFDIHLNLF